MSSLILNKNESSKLSQILSSLSLNDEFEVMFGGYKKNNNIKLHQFLNLLKFLKNYSDANKIKIEHNESLDILYNYDPKNFHTYRISIDGIDNINHNMSSIFNRDNNLIFSILVSKLLDKSENKGLSIINKIRNFESTYDLDRYDMRIRTSKELKVPDSKLKELINLQNIDKMSIIFRMKSRLSLILEDSKQFGFRIDLTSVRQSLNVNTIQNKSPNYELELEILKRNKLPKDFEKEIIDKMNLLKKIINQSNYVISLDEKNDILSRYNNLIFKDNKPLNELYGMKPVSLEAVHLIENIPINYALCDKADGEHYLGIIFNSKLYLIATNLDVKFSGVTLASNKYDDTILDGEYILNTKHNKYIFITWDIIYYKSKDVRSSNLKERLEMLNDVIANGFKFNSSYNKYDGNFDLKLIRNHYEKDMRNYLKYLSKELSICKNETLVCNKYFCLPIGGSKNEIYLYSDILWNIFTNTDSDNLPYVLDGLIYTPINQIYTADVKFLEHKIYKWKPPNKNSIDFYVTTVKDKATNKDVLYYDNTYNENTYKILNLHVGRSINNIEMPILFREKDNLYVAKIGDDNGVIRDIEGDIIQDESVVEFYYLNNTDLPTEFRWIPIRTRYDKTEFVKRYKKKYGNNSNIANFIWNSIQQNITMDDISRLGNIDIYENELFKLKKKIDASIIAKETQKDVYYQTKIKLGTNMRNFHNYIKSNLIYEYCSPKNDKKLSILDTGVGRGGDIMKFFHARVSNVVGFDPDYNGIHSTTDGAISRYDNMRRKYPQFPKMEFIVSDAGALLNLESQRNAIGKMSSMNEDLIKNTFGSDKNDLNNSKFDVFNSQMMLHFLFKNDDILDNYCQNINNFLKDDGIVLITTLDGDSLHKEFVKNNGVINSFYNKDGENNKYFEFTSNYDLSTDNINKTGCSYEAYLATFKKEGNTDTEYIISKSYLIDVFKKKCNLSLVETDMFYSIYKQKKHFFENIAPKEEKAELKKFLMNISEFYNMDDSVNVASLEFSKLHRYYIFKKNHNLKSETKKIAKKRGKKI